MTWSGTEMAPLNQQQQMDLLLAHQQQTLALQMQQSADQQQYANQSQQNAQQWPPAYPPQVSPRPPTPLEARIRDILTNPYIGWTCLEQLAIDCRLIARHVQYQDLQLSHTRSMLKKNMCNSSRDQDHYASAESKIDKLGKDNYPNAELKHIFAIS